MAVPGGIANPVAWLSSELKLKRKNGRYLNAPDIAEATATVTDGVLSVSFAEPYVIPAEGVYVGYSFEVIELDASTSAPVSTGPPAPMNPGSFFTPPHQDALGVLDSRHGQRERHDGTPAR